MSCIDFPDSVPDERSLRLLLNTRRHYVFKDQEPLQIQRGTSIATVSVDYAKHMAAFLWREAAIRLVLSHAKELQLDGALADNLAMVLSFMDEVYEKIHAEASSSSDETGSAQSQTLYQYLVTEYFVRRQEPVNIRAFRRTNDINLNWYDFKSCGKYSFTSGTFYTDVHQIGNLTGIHWGPHGPGKECDSSLTSRMRTLCRWQGSSST